MRVWTTADRVQLGDVIVDEPLGPIGCDGVTVTAISSALGRPGSERTGDVVFGFAETRTTFWVQRDRTVVVER